MLFDAIILLRKVYAHNFSKFDGIFIVKILGQLHKEKLVTLKFVKRDSNLISITVNFTEDGEKYSIEFRDSLLMLPSSLRKLSKAFNVESKGYFPF